MSETGQSKTVKPQLHKSMLESLAKCGVQFQRRYGHLFGCWHKEEIVPPGIALVTGTSVHKAVEANLRNKIEKETMLPRGEVAEIAENSFMNSYENQEIMLDEEEALNVKETIGKASTMAANLAILHYDNLAPTMNPVAVEEKFVIEMNGYPIDLAGTKDIREADSTIRDTKTTSKKQPENSALNLQMAMYSLSEKTERGALPKEFKFDYLIKTKIPKVQVCSVVPTDNMLKPLYFRIENFIQLIESVKEGKGCFTPADPSSWVCTKKYCGYATTCPYWSGM